MTTPAFIMTPEDRSNCRAYAEANLRVETGIYAEWAKWTLSLLDEVEELKQKVRTEEKNVSFWKRMAGAFGVDLKTFRRDGVDAEEILSLLAETVFILAKAETPRAARAADAIRFVVKTFADEDDEPLPLIINCPRCHLQHVDVDDETGEWATRRLHRKHLCKPEDGGCGFVWKPSNRYTVGVRELPEVEG